MQIPRLQNRLVSLAVLLLTGVGVLSLTGQPTRGDDPVTSVMTVFQFTETPQSRMGYRIPALAVSHTGKLLAFCERRDGLHDHAANDLVLRRSSDGGQSWEPIQVVAEEGDDSLNDPCVIVLETGRILLRYTHFPQGVHARKTAHTVMADPGYGGAKNVRILLTHSDDEGLTWSVPRDVTRAMRREQAISLGSPGVGVQLTRGTHRGRIIFPNYEVYGIGDNETSTLNSVSFSDDGGETWVLSGEIEDASADATGNEAQLAELPDGGLLMTSRILPEINGRLLAFSHDGGATWSKHRQASDLLTPACMASVLRYSWPGDESGSVLLQSLPRTQESRSNGTLMISRDEGQSWQPIEVIVPGDFAYSCLARLPNGDVGCLYETDDYHKVDFVRLSPEVFLTE